MSPHEHSLAPHSIYDYGIKMLSVLKDQWRHNHACLLALMSVVGAIVSCSWMLMSDNECL